MKSFTLFLPLILLIAGCGQDVEDAKLSVFAIENRLHSDRREFVRVLRELPFIEPGSIEEAEDELLRINAAIETKDPSLSIKERSLKPVVEKYISDATMGRRRLRQLRKQIEEAEQILLEVTGEIPRDDSWDFLNDSDEAVDSPFR